MNSNIHIDPIDEVLRIIFIESSLNLDDQNSSKQLLEILKAEYPVSIQAKERETIINSLIGQANSLSFGGLINNALASKKITVKELSIHSKVDESVIEKLKSDSIFTSNIPVMLVKNLLVYLNIPFSLAEASIIKTFDLLKLSATTNQESLPNMSPSFRKETYSLKETFNGENVINENNELFQNKEALRKYLTRLNDLINVP